MKTCLRVGAMPTINCEQSWCVLRDKTFTLDDIGEILLMTISGKSTANHLASDRVIVALPRCKVCVMRVLQGGRAYLTQDEWDRLNALGQWHRRRSRRRAA